MLFGIGLLFSLLPFLNLAYDIPGLEAGHFAYLAIAISVHQQVIPLVNGRDRIRWRWRPGEIRHGDYSSKPNKSDATLSSANADEYCQSMV